MLLLRQYNKPVCNSYKLSLLFIFEKNELANQFLRENDKLCPDRRNPVHIISHAYVVYKSSGGDINWTYSSTIFNKLSLGARKNVLIKDTSMHVQSTFEVHVEVQLLIATCMDSIQLRKKLMWMLNYCYSQNIQDDLHSAFW